MPFVCICLLCDQVGVFSPSHRNHYLNVTPNNLLKIYNPDGVSVSSTQLPPLVLVSTTTVSWERTKKIQLHPNKYLICHPETLCQPVSCRPLSLSMQEPMSPSATVLQDPVSRMQLVFDEEDDDEGQEEGKCTGGEDPRAPADTRFSSSRAPQEPAGNPAPQDTGWDAGGTSCIVVIIHVMRQSQTVKSGFVDKNGNDETFQ